LRRGFFEGKEIFFPKNPMKATLMRKLVKGGDSWRGGSKLSEGENSWKKGLLYQRKKRRNNGERISGKNGDFFSLKNSSETGRVHPLL